KVKGSTTEWTQEITDKGKVSFVVPEKPTKTTVYELVSINNATCTRIADFGTETAKVEVIEPANAGTNGTLTVDEGTTPTKEQLFNALGGTPDKNGIWTNEGNTYTYTVKSKSPCTADVTAKVIVKVKEIQVSEPILNIYQQTICPNDKAHFTITNYDKNLTYEITPSKGVVVNSNKIEVSEGTYTIISKKGKKESSKVVFKVIVDATLPNCDADNDGLTNAEEISVGTNPNNKDTDGDGINDLEEIGTIESPMDTDDDGKIDALESNTKDEDGDGVVAQLDKYDDDPCYPKVSAKCDLNAFEYPEGFSPNDDGINDKLVFPFLKKYTRNKVYIYNRYGNLVFKTSKYGLYDNYFEGFSTVFHLGKEKLPVGTYYYVIEFYVNEETLVKKTGFVFMKY
ncbi:MAG: gliding motility-associated C-terminal domain-containing protein, partial [Flavobacteriaceae bacterium]|nr:gliding motility-associated C-terminal domain-containing protein [Flavobacteriaceae bacterium]